MKKKFLDALLYVAAAIVVLALLFAGAYFHPWLLAVGILSLMLGVACFYLWRFSHIILVLENDLGGAIEALEEVEGSLGQIIEMKLYFDTPEVQQMVSHVMDSVRMAKFSVNKMIKSFTDRSKQKFVMVIEEEEDNEDEAGLVDRDAERAQAQQQEHHQRHEGTIASVGRQNN